jgi:hypothetical protein
MVPIQRQAARVCIVLAGIIFLAETLFGCIAILGIGVDTGQDVLLDLCLTMSLPIFLISLRYRTAALVGLWAFFVIQWIGINLTSRPPLLNPLNDWHDDLLFAGVCIYTGGFILYRRKYSQCPVRSA